MTVRWQELGIEHVVVLMLENRSFDQVLGSLPASSTDKAIDGVSPGISNKSGNGVDIPLHEITDPSVSPSPNHSYESVWAQIACGQMSGFVTDYERVTGVGIGSEAATQVMGYYVPTAETPGPAGYIQYLASEYAVSDRWFCSLPAETWPNRLFAHAATSGCHFANDIVLYDMETIYDRLDAASTLPVAGRRWAIYCDFVPQLACVERFGLKWLTTRHQRNSRFRSLQQFEDDCKQGSLPTYAFIEPRYFGPKHILPKADDGHPPHDLGEADRLVKRTYLALRQSPAWEKTLLLITFDEHGGFYDHVAPPSAPAPEALGGRSFTPLASAVPNPPFDFTMLGPRVPFVMVSSRALGGIRIRPNEGRYFDHTSILATVERLFGLPPLTTRDRDADDLLHWISATPEAAPSPEDGPPIADSIPPSQMSTEDVPEEKIAREADEVLADLDGVWGDRLAAAILAWSRIPGIARTELAVSLCELVGQLVIRDKASHPRRKTTT